ncbi:MAG: MFS transporter [Vicinamibacterales bacterium]
MPVVSASLLPVFLIVLVDVFGMTLVFPLLAIYAESFSATPLQATLLVSTFAVCQLLTAPVIGHWSDRIGRKPMLVLSQLGTCLGFIILARAHALWVIYLSRVIDGATAGNISLAQSYIADHTRPEDRTRAFGLLGVAFGIGFFIGPGITGVLSARYGLTAPIWLAAALSFTSVICTLVLLDGARPAGRRPPAAPLSWRTYFVYFERPAMRGHLVQFLCYALAFSSFLSGFALFAERRFVWSGRPFGPQEIGAVFAFVGLFAVAMQAGVLGRLSRRLGDVMLVRSGLLTLVAGFLLLGTSSSLIALAISAMLLAYANSVLRPALSSQVSRQAGPHEQGVVAGLMASLVSIASIVAPAIGGFFIGHQQLAAWAWVAAGMAALGVALSLVNPRPAGAAASAS